MKTLKIIFMIVLTVFALSCMEMYNDIADELSEENETIVTTIAGSYPVATSGFVDATGTAARFYDPFDITTDGSNLYVLDTYNNSIRKMVISTGVVTTIAGSATSGNVDATGTAARFNNPRGITTDGANLYVSDTGNNAIRKIVISTGVVTTITSGVNTPRGIVYSDLNLYVVEINSHLIKKIVISTGVVTTLAGSTNGFLDGTGTGAKFESPIGITTDGINLYVSDTNNYRIRKIVISTGVVTTIAGSGSATLLDGVGTAATFNQPVGIVYYAGYLYIADWNNNAIRQIKLSGSHVTTIAGSYPIPASGFIDGIGNAARFNGLRGVTTDGTNIYVADTGNSAIRKINSRWY